MGRLIGSILGSGSGSRSRTSRVSHLPSIPEEPIQLAAMDEFFNLILELDALLRIIAMIMVVQVVLIRIALLQLRR